MGEGMGGAAQKTLSTHILSSRMSGLVFAHFPTPFCEGGKAPIFKTTPTPHATSTSYTASPTLYG